MATWNLTTASDVFKTNYLRLSENTYNSANVLLGRVKKSYNFTGSQMNIAIPLSFQGGVGSGSLPTAGVADYDQAVISAKKVYSVVLIDREAIKASANDQGAFVRGLKEVVKKGVESYMRNASRILFGNGDGSLGVVDSASGTNPYVLTIASGYNEANFEENDIVNIETGNTDPFNVDTVAPQTDGTLDVTVTRNSGSQAPASTDEVFMQNSEDNDPNGLEQVTDATSSTLYSVTVGRRWRSTQIDAASGGLTVDLMNEAMLEIERKSGKTPNLIVCSYTQFKKILDLSEDQKEYNIPPRYGSDKMKASLSFSGVQFMSSRGAIGVFPERFCPPDRVYFLNDNYIEVFHRPDFGWFDDDGTVFLREASADSYSARYGGYYQNYIPPVFHGRIDALATS
jgi:hypothetical protein